MTLQLLSSPPTTRALPWRGHPQSQRLSGIPGSTGSIGIPDIPGRGAGDTGRVPRAALQPPQHPAKPTGFIPHPLQSV